MVKACHAADSTDCLLRQDREGDEEEEAQQEEEIGGSGGLLDFD